VPKYRRLLKENIYHVYNRKYTVFTKKGYTDSVLFCRKLNTESSVPFTILPSTQRKFNPLKPKDPYSGRTAPQNPKVAFYIFIQQIYY
jgi:hypothetical protein